MNHGKHHEFLAVGTRPNSGRQDYSFYPINRALSLDSDDAEDYSERQVRIKDLEEMRGVVRQCSETSLNHGLKSLQGFRHV